MTRFLKQLPLLIGLIASPVLAAPPDEHASHHADATATLPPEKAAQSEHHCPMMDPMTKPGETATPSMDHAKMKAECMAKMAASKSAKPVSHSRKRKRR
jgi:hypothetical protein